MKTRAKAVKKHAAKMHKKRVFNMQKAHASHANTSEERMTADPLSKRLMAATEVEKKAFALAAQAGVAAIDIFERMSRYFLGMPTAKRSKRLPRKRSTLKGSVERRGSRAVSRPAAA